MTNDTISLSQRVSDVALPVIEDILAISGTPAISFAVCHLNETLPSFHLGFRDIERRIKADDDTRFNINSMTKGMLAALTGVEVSKGTIKWDSRIVQYPLLVQEPCLCGAEEHFTVEDMLSHRSGICDFTTPWLHSNNTIILKRNQLVDIYRYLPPLKPFRAAFLYNNGGYELVGAALEEATEQSVAELFQVNLFGPLGMSRTSTSWNSDDENQAKSYTVLDDLTTVEIPRPQVGKGTIMEAAGGVKSTLKDLMIYYKEFLKATKEQCGITPADTSQEIFKECPKIIKNHISFEGPSLYEQGYGLGFARCQLPGQLGRVSLNPSIGEEPIVGKGAASRLVIYHHGSMPGSTTCVLLVPETDTVIIVLQNSLAPVDTADFVAQCLLETVLEVPEPNDYRALTAQFVQKSLRYMHGLKFQLESACKFGTRSRELGKYVGRYKKLAQDFFLDIREHAGRLQVCFQGIEHDTYDLEHYQDDTFSWLMSYNEAMRRGRYTMDFGASFYLIVFNCDREGSLEWAWNPDMPDMKEVFYS